MKKAKEVRELDLDGVYVAEDSIRHYPFGSFFLSHVLGFAGIDNQGLLGLEAYYDDDLKGEKKRLCQVLFRCKRAENAR
ncbi:hypothetical protein BsIDN1_27230 [Bacillus safensis]|uniref:serine-type D-Ala-D-Ala carboxypeptidase n=1 Tax=Bacillus safensis TaxID=561879 RepID=A0A5S9M8C3_BACIA|nr:hypothetical protein BsIDN1_27230 [Bacillus safensis]